MDGMVQGGLGGTNRPAVLCVIGTRPEAIKMAPGSVHLTGNTVVDALLDMAARLPRAATMPDGTGPLVLMTLHRRESFDGGAERVLGAVRLLCATMPGLRVLYPVHPDPQLRGLAARVLGDLPQVRLAEPLSYPDLVAALARCTLVLTDSGGLQEEAPAFGKPVLVTREVTERPEAVALGVARLVGTDPDRILREAMRLLTDPAAHAEMARGASPYGDGQAAGRIAAIVEATLLGGVPDAAPLGRAPSRIEEIVPT